MWSISFFLTLTFDEPIAMSTQRLRKQASNIFQAALKAADPAGAVARHLESRDTSRFQNIYVIGAGKAGASMAKAAEKVLGRRITGGLINVKYGHLAKLKRIELNECGHPVPDQQGVDGAARIAAIAEKAGKDDLVICLISGGGSALLPLPAEPITLEEKQATTKLLLACGANIHEINAIRKHISRIKGGQLARLAFPATVEALMLSDVIGDDLDVIGSGPTAPDASTFAGAVAILERYGILARVPAAVRERLEAGIRGEIPETPKPADPIFKRVRNTIVGSCELALDAAAKRAGAFERDSGRNARRGAHARRHRPRDTQNGTAGQAARLHHHRRRDHRDAQRARLGRPEPGVRAGRRPGYRRLAGRGGVQRRHGRHRRPHGRRGRHCRWRYAQPQARRSPLP
jgi:glycerate-2-kinase